MTEDEWRAEVLRLLQLILAELIELNSDDNYKEPGPSAPPELENAITSLEDSLNIDVGQVLWRRRGEPEREEVGLV